jgi:hypothetical protein
VGYNDGIIKSHEIYPFSMKRVEGAKNANES